MPGDDTAGPDNRLETYKRLTTAQSALFDALGTAQKGLLRNPSPEQARALNQTILDLNERIATLEARILAVRSGTTVAMPTDAQVAAVADMTKALRQQAGAGDQKSAAASAEAAVKAAQAAADRARKVHDRLHAMLREAQASKPADMTTKLLAEDVAQVDAAAKKSAQAAADAAARVKEVAKRSKDLASIAAPERRTELEAEIAEIMTKLMADVADAESHANKAQKIASRRL